MNGRVGRKAFTWMIAVLALAAMSTIAEARPGGGRGRSGGGATRGGATGGVRSGRPAEINGAARPTPAPRPAGSPTPGARPLGNGGSIGAQEVQGFLNLPAAGQGVRDQIGSQQLSGHAEQVRGNANSWIGNAQNGPQPFSPAWYAQHPNAWQYAHPHADAWAAATVAATVNWFGWTSTGGSAGGTSVTYVETAPAEPTPAASSSDQGQGDLSIVQTEAAGEWLSLGVFVLQRPGGSGRQVVQLAVDRSARVQGVYYDEMLGATINVVGAVDRATQRVSWSPESNPSTTFAADLAGITSPETDVEVITAAGREQWRAVRLEAPQ